MNRSKVGVVVGIVVVVLVVLSGFVWLIGSSNPSTPAGYVGYLTQGSVFGKAKFYGLQTGPTSAGRTWLLEVTNVSVTPYTYTEPFTGDAAVLAKGNLKLEFQAHSVFRVKPDGIKDFMEHFSVLINKDQVDKDPDIIVKNAYGNFIREQFRTFVRDEVQKREGLEVKDQLITIGEAVQARIREYAKNSPFDIQTVVVGNIQYPKEVADAVAKKMAATQELEQRDTMIEIARKDNLKRTIEADGIAKAMDTIQTKLTPMYLQHEAIEAQKMMVGSPNHTTIYIPVGNNGVPLVGTLDLSAKPVEKK